MHKLFRILRDGEPDPANAADPTDSEVIDDETPGDDETSEEPTEAELENIKLKDKIAELEKPKTSTSAPMTAASMDNFTEEQWINLELQTKKDRATIKSEYRSWEINKRQDDTEARQNVRDAIQDEVEKDPRLGKLKTGMKEYLATLPSNQKIGDLKEHMQNAIYYAKGKYGFTKTPKPKDKKAPNLDSDDISYDDDLKNTGAKKGEIEDGDYVSKNGEKIHVGAVIDKKEWNKVQSNDRGPNNVKIPDDYDEAPSFD